MALRIRKLFRIYPPYNFRNFDMNTKMQYGNTIKYITTSKMV